MDILKSATIFLQGSIKTDKKKTVREMSCSKISSLSLLLTTHFGRLSGLSKIWKNL